MSDYRWRRKSRTHSAYGRVYALADQSLFKTSLFTLVSACVTIANGRPREIDSCAAAGEQEVVLYAEEVSE